MTDAVSTPQVRKGARHQRPSFKDARFTVGVLLVVLSVLAGYVVFQKSQSGIGVYVANADITVGQQVSKDDFHVERLGLNSTSTQFMRSNQTLPTNSVALTAIAAGSVLGQTDVGASDTYNYRPISIEIPQGDSARYTSGSYVDIWSSASTTIGSNKEPEPPAALVTGARILSVSQNSSFGSQSAKVHVMVPSDSLPQILQSQSNQDILTLIEVPTAGNRQ